MTDINKQNQPSSPHPTNTPDNKAPQDGEAPAALHASAPPENRPAEAESPSVWKRLSMPLQLTAALLLAGGALIYLLWGGHVAHPPAAEVRPLPKDEVVEVVGPRLIRVCSETPLDAKLEITTAQTKALKLPLLKVTGRILASVRPGKDKSENTWQFATGELLTDFTEWENAVQDIDFQESQLEAIKKFDQQRVAAQKKIVALMEKLVAAGTETPRDLAAEQNALMEFQIEGQRDIREAEKEVRLARRMEATLARQLQQAGLEPNLLRTLLEEDEIVDVVVAEVPEAKAGRVYLGMASEVRFLALPGRVFTAEVTSISPVLSQAKRVLHVQFVVKDTPDAIRPGMFAEVGLGTKERDVMLVPADGVLHVGRSDYVLAATEDDTWYVTEVQTGALLGTHMEIISGLEPGTRIMGKGAILLKPYVSFALHQVPPTPDVAVHRQ